MMLRVVLAWLLLCGAATAQVGQQPRYIQPVVGGAAWTPATLGANLAVWYKADDGPLCSGSACLNGGTVTSWADKSGNAVNLVPNFTNATTFHSAGLGGKESLGFVLSGALGTATNGMTTMGTGNASSCFILGSLAITSSGSGLSYAASGQSGPTGANSIDWFDVATTPAFTWGHAFASGTNTSVTANTETQMGMTVDGSAGVHTAISYVGGSAVNTDTSISSFSFTSPGTFTVGSGSNGWVGEIREIFCSTTVISASDITTLVTPYLTSRQ